MGGKRSIDKARFALPLKTNGGLEVKRVGLIPDDKKELLKDDFEENLRGMVVSHDQNPQAVKKQLENSICDINAQNVIKSIQSLDLERLNSN